MMFVHPRPPGALLNVGARYNYNAGAPLDLHSAETSPAPTKGLGATTEVGVPLLWAGGVTMLSALVWGLPVYLAGKYGVAKALPKQDSDKVGWSCVGITAAGLATLLFREIRGR